ncbi:MAG: PKD domain-containing protein [Bacteroidetes bacterium]|nr:PKD domain-containing protein [Bacteroidota bacterium]
MIYPMRFFALLLLFFSFAGTTSALTITSVSSGNWNTSSTWDCNCIPGSADDVIVGHSVGISNTATAGSMTINSVASLNVGNAFMVNGSVTINGTLTITSTTGSKNFGDILINSIGTWNNSSNANVTVNGNLTNNGSFTSGTGTCTFTGSGKFFDGSSSITIQMAQINGSYTNNNNLLITFSLSGNGSLTQSTNTLLQLGGTVTISTLTASASGNTVIYNANGSQTIFCTTYYNLTLTGSGTKTFSCNTFINGQLTNNSSTTLDATTFTITLSGNFINDGNFFPSSSTFFLAGSAVQSLSGFSTITFNNLTINNVSSTGITLNQDVTVMGTLMLNDGIIYSSSANLLILSAGSTVSPQGGTQTSFVDGPVRKTGSTAFVFPTGDNGRWRRIAMSALASATDQFDAEYFFQGYGNYNLETDPSPSEQLTDVSQGEYWTLDRTAGTATPQITLAWEDASASGIDDCGDLRIARFNSVSSWWENNNDNVITNGSCTGTNPGTITTGSAVFTFSPFTFGSKNALVNPLFVFACTPATFWVTDTTDSGAGSLRQAITDANANCGHDTIKFNLGMASAYKIAVLTPLPPLTDTSGVTIDGWSNMNNSGIPNTVSIFNTSAGNPLNPVYKIILTNSGSVPVGLQLASDNNVIQGMVLQDFGDGTVSNNDIAIIVTGNNNKILGCFIGMAPDGITKGTRTWAGIEISGQNNIIGDGTAAGTNLISGMNNGGYGISITGSNAATNSVMGNIIGLQKNGVSMVFASQTSGIYISGGASGNKIGDISGEGNVISGNAGYGIEISNSENNKIIGNIIGPQSNGTFVVASNTQLIGVRVVDAGGNIIGGATSLERNIISANGTSGIAITGMNATLNEIIGNYIGTSASGSSIISSGSQDYGVQIASGASSNIIGGTGLGEGNLISGNTNYGIYFSSSGTGGNTVLGNIIGPQANGTSYLTGNLQSYGIYIFQSPANIIGGTTTAERNVISANEIGGLYLFGASTTGNYVKGNYIGIDRNGTSFITSSTQDYGMFIGSSAVSNIIGGSNAGEGNLISGNSNYGIYIAPASTVGNTVKGNIIGPQFNGSSFINGNLQNYGVFIDLSGGNIIGGNNAGERNIISGNQTAGVMISSSDSNSIKGNYIGIDSSGTTFIASSSQDYGVSITGSSSGNLIGGANAGDGNVISGNTSSGILTTSFSLGGNTVKGNIIGPQADGATYLVSNTQSIGIAINNSANNIIGNNSTAERNIISANTIYGIYISGSGSFGNFIRGNYIGPDISGTLIISGSNQDYGIQITSGSELNTIGGDAFAGYGNLISGNTNNGIFINSTVTNGNIIWGNIIGPQMDGNTFLASNTQVAGIALYGSAGNIIGGNSDTTRNIISGNFNYGIYIQDTTATGNIITGNYIGPGKNSASIASSSQNRGVYILSSASSDFIGGSGPGEGNIIAYNTANGVEIFSAGSINNLISRNSIYSNPTTAIKLNYGASQGNNGKPVPVVSGANTALVTGTSEPGDVVEIFKNTSGNCQDAVTYLGTVVTDTAGRWAFPVTLTTSEYVLATATDTANNTSEFSACRVAVSCSGFAATIVKTDVSCGGSIDGSATVFIAGGTIPYSYAWSNGETLSTITGLSAGSYTVTVSDLNACGDTLTVTITEPLAISITESENDISCNGAMDGSINITVSGGAPSYSFQWSNLETTEDITGLSAGIYTVTVTDLSGCTADSSFTLTQPAQLSASTVVLPVSCYGDSTGSIDMTVTGGTPPYVYSWSSGDSTEDLSNLAAGTYLVTITDSNNCILATGTIITQPSVLSVITTSTFNYDTCNGTVFANVTGGALPYNYLWDDTSGATTDTVTGLCGGAYHVTVTDNNGCTATDSATVITAMVSFTIDTSGGCPPVTVNFTNTSNLGVSGVAYLWYFGTDGPYFVYDTSYTFNSGGIFPVYLFAIDTDLNVLGNDSMNLAFSGSSGFFVMTDDTVCPGDNIIFVDDVNSSPYYDWNFGDGFYQNGPNNLVIHSWYSPGTYYVSLAVNTVCGADTINQPVVVSNISALAGPIQAGPQPVCPGDQLQIASFGSAGNFTWDFGDGTVGYSGLPYTVHTYDSAGSYIISMTVTNGCNFVFSAADTFIVSGGLPVTGNFEITANPDPVCPGDLVKFKFEEGENFSGYQWDFGDGNTFSGYSTVFHSYSSTGNYNISVTVTNGCGSSTLITTTVSVQNGVTAEAGEYSYGVIPSAACPNDSIIFYIDGLTEGGYVWNFGDGNSDSVFTPFDSSAIIAHAYSATGTYQATITITNGCGSSVTDTIAVWVSDSFSVIPSWWGEGFTWEGRNEGPLSVCQPVDFFAFGGSLFTWDFGDGDTLSTFSLGVSHTYNSAGFYTVTLDVQNSCGNSRQYSNLIRITGSCTPPSVSFTAANPSCSGSNDGWIEATAAGGTPPYTFQWSTGEITTDTLLSLVDSLAGGTYYLTLTDAINAQATDTIILTPPSSLSMVFAFTDVTCNDTCDGTAALSVSGGTPPYTFSWSNGANSPSLSSLCIGIYPVTVTDSLSCIATDSAAIGGIPGFFADLAGNPDTNWISPATVRDGLCCTAGAPDRCVHFIVNTDSLADRIYININSGAVPPGSNYYIDNCDPASTTLLGDTLCLTASGQHNITFCKPGTNVNDYIIGTRKRPSVNAGSDIMVCPETDSIPLNSSGSGAVSYLWTSSGSGSFYPNASAINPVYIPSATDSASGGLVELVFWGVGTCTNVRDTVLIQFVQPISLSVTSTPECEPNTGVASVSATGGAPPYAFLWSNGDTDSWAAALTSGTYTVTVTDAAGCGNSVTASVGSGVAFTAAISALINPFCNGGSDGTATAIGSNMPSQSFSVAPNAAIPDTGCSSFNGVNSMINVSGYSVAVNSSGIKATLNIIHTFDSDLQIFLTAPNGNTLMLSTGNGGNDSNYINTVFTDGALISITMGSPPFTGIFKPEGGLTASCGVTPTIATFGAIGGGSINPNGNWTLKVFDNMVIDTGRVVNWSITIPPGPVAGASFSYQWNDPFSQTDSLATGLAAGTYDVIITDSAGCDDTASVFLTDPPVVTSGQTLAICSGDSAQLPDGTWVDSAGTYTSVLTTIAGCDSVITITIQMSPVCCVPVISVDCSQDFIDDFVFSGIINLSTGCNGNPNNYIYYPADTAKIIKGNSYLIQATPSTFYPEGIGVWIDFNKNGSFGDAGEFVFSAPPGTTPVSGNIIVPPSAQLGLTFMRVMAKYNLTPLPGDYCDSLSWGETEDYPVMILPTTIGSDVGVIEIFNPGSSCSLSATETVSVKIKNFGTDTVNTIPVRYSVNGGIPVAETIFTTIDPGDTLLYDFSTPYDFSSDGIYTIDAWTKKLNDTIESNDSTLNYLVENYTDLNVTSLVKNASCGDVKDGAIFLNFTDGTPPYVGSWTSSTGSGSDTLYSSDTLIKNVAPDQYDIILTDSNSCSDSLTVVITAPPAIISSFVSVSNVTCGGGSDGAIDLSVNGGTGSYTYLWIRYSDTSLVGLTQDINNLLADIYVVFIYDANNCDDTNFTQVAEPPALTVFFTTTPDSCSLSCEGAATASVVNGTPPLTYVWSNGFSGTSVTGLCGGNIILSVTDSTNCKVTDSVKVITLNLPSPVITSPGNYCEGQKVDTIFATPQSGGKILWYGTPSLSAPIDSGLIFFPVLTLGTNYFYVTERDSECESPATLLEISLFSLPPADAGPDVTVCLGESAQLIASGGISYLWKPSAGLNDTTVFNPVARPVDTTEYFVIVTDGNNCSARDSVTVAVDKSDNCWHIFNMFSPNGDGVNDKWFIDGIVRFPQNNITIYNRFENKVAEFVNYDNNNVVWKGENNHNDPLPGGTYFYVVDVVEKKFTGWVQVIR